MDDVVLAEAQFLRFYPGHTLVDIGKLTETQFNALISRIQGVATAFAVPSPVM